MRERLLLGAPGVYPMPDEPVRALTGVRMDVAAFVGVAPRGPARLPAYGAWWSPPPCGPTAPLRPLRSVAVRVEGWDEYRRLYGGFEGPGLLPYAVAAFFENGGRAAYVVRVVHDYGAGSPANGAGTARGTVAGATPRGGGDLTLRARDEGRWGNALRATLAFRPRPLAFDSATLSTLTFGADAPVARGLLLRCWLPGGLAALRFVADVRDEWSPERPVRRLVATLERPLDDAPLRIEAVEGELAVEDASDPSVPRGELHERLAFSPLHPRWLAAVLHADSALVRPDPAWIWDDLVVGDPALRAPEPGAPGQFTGGLDRYADLVPGDFFDPAWVPEDEIPRAGVHALMELEDVSLVVVPDLYSPGPLVQPRVAADPPPLAGPEFAPCVEVAPPPEPEPAPDQLDGLHLDPTVPADLERIVELQQALVELAGTARSWIVLLDVPPGLDQRRILAWRARFASAWAAAYHPWLRTARADDARDPLVSVCPAAFAAGIIARTENESGIAQGPANVLAGGAASVTDRVSRLRHDELHQAAVNVFVPERDGIRLTAARTLSRDPQWRQLSVRRLVTLLRRTLLREMQWVAFEPNDAALRDQVERMLERYLERLFRANAFRGRTPAEAFFVRCDDRLNPQPVLDAGMLVCEVGVAVAEPIEFIVLRLSRGGDGVLTVEG